MDGIRYWIETEGSGHWFFLAFPIALLCLFIWFKERRVRFIVPSLLISIVIINPWFYKKWDKLGLYAYWRILWVVPVVPVVAGLIPSITERIQKDWLKGIVAGAGVGLIVFGGTFLYNGAGGSFVEAANAAKEPDYVVQIADRLLELDEHPRVIAQDPIGVYLRQYTGEIDQLFGRDLNGYVFQAKAAAKQINNAINEGDWKTVSQMMLDDDYDYLVVSEEPDVGFTYVDSVAGYGIFKATGTPSVIKERNELGQVISCTTIDTDGQPINGEAGYSTVAYKYDENGYISYEFYADVNGNGVENSNGIAGYERQYDSKGHVITERTINAESMPCAAFQNYAEVRREYAGNHVIAESYFDETGNRTKQLAGHVSIQQQWDGDKLIGRQYLDGNGQMINRIDGYSRFDYSGKDIEFLDAGGNIVPLEGLNLFGEPKAGSDGWSDWITPNPQKNSNEFIIGNVNLGEKDMGDAYSCQIEIEFRDVTSNGSFLFCTQGTVDGTWNTWNPWDHIAYLTEAPMEGIYQFNGTYVLNENMADATEFQIGFRCDNWNSGSFRVRKIKIEKNDSPSEWTPGL